MPPGPATSPFETSPEATPRAAMDAAVAELVAKKAAWTQVSIRERLALLERMTRDFAAVADRWAAASSAAEGLRPGLPGAGEEPLVGPYFILRNLRLLRQALSDIAAQGSPRIAGPVTWRPAQAEQTARPAHADRAHLDGQAPQAPDAPVPPEAAGQVVARVFPQDVYDRLFYLGVTAEVWMEPGVTREGLAATQALAYRKKDGGGVALVLGAGNVTSIGPMDAFYKLFVEDRVVLFKTHPVNAFLGPLLEEGMGALSERGFFRLVHGGAEEGAYLCSHPGVDEIHITGSDRTYEAIVFGTGEEGRRRKERDAPVLTKPISTELGNVSPVIVVPGPWSEAEIAFQAENLATMLVNNAGFNCNASRVIIQHAAWPLRLPLLDAVRRTLAQAPPRRAWYPGAASRFDAFLAAHPPPESESLGERAGDALPWLLIPGLDPARRDDICFTTEAFCGVCGEVPLAAASVPEFLERAVAFANDTLWGTLNVTLLVHPASLRDAATARAVERAVAELRYGTVSLNHWAAIGFGLVVTPWGAFPGHTRRDIQSGTGVVHNTPMFSRVQKSVVRAPFHPRPKPVWFINHRTAERLTPRLVRFEAAPSPLKLPGIFSLALRG